MKLNRLLFDNPNYILEGKIDFSNATLDPYHIRKIEEAEVRITGENYEDLLTLNIKIKVRVIGVCSYTLEDVPMDLNIRENLEISDEIKDDEVIFYEKNAIFDIDPYILSIIISEVPAKIVKKGAKLPSSGDGYRVISEEEFLKEEENKIDPRWSKLDDIDL